MIIILAMPLNLSSFKDLLSSFRPCLLPPLTKNESPTEEMQVQVSRRGTRGYDSGMSEDPMRRPVGSLPAVGQLLEGMCDSKREQL